MRKYFIGFFIGALLLTSINAFAFRTSKPPSIKDVEITKSAEFNNFLEQMWNISNGRYNLNVVTSVPSGIAEEGDMKAYFSGATYRLYIYINGSWRYFNIDG